MTEQQKNFPEFYVTAPQPCPYLEGQFERKLFTHLTHDKPRILVDNLLKGAARSLLSDTLQIKTAEIRIDSIDALSQKIVNSLCDDDLVMRDMFLLMTHDYCSYTH